MSKFNPAKPRSSTFCQGRMVTLACALARNAAVLLRALIAEVAGTGEMPGR